MVAENQIQVADARQAYLHWNTHQYEQLLNGVGAGSHKLLQLIPLFLQLNNRLLPGYTGPDSPYGIYGYVPGKDIVNEARLLNTKFRYHQEGVIKNYAIDSIMLQHRLIDNELNCWVFYRSTLNKNQVSVISEKINKIAHWFSARDIKLSFKVISDDEFRNNNNSIGRINKSIFLDCFYSEMLLLAGKYPVWWLVPPASDGAYEDVVEHIKKARFVDEEEFIDLGSTAEYSRADLLQYAVDQVQTIKKSSETCLVSLLVTDQKSSVWPNKDGISSRLKRMLYQQQSNVNPLDVMTEIMHEAFNFYSDDSHISMPTRLFSNLKNIPGNLNVEIIDAFLGEDSYQQSNLAGIENIISYLNVFKAINHEIHQIFSHIVTQYTAQSEQAKLDQSLLAVAHNMLAFLSESTDRIPLYNNRNKDDIVFDRILLRHQLLNQSEDMWSLVLAGREGDEKTIEGFSSLLGLLAWCWLNRVVNHATQISIDSQGLQVKQTEARYVLEVLMQQIKPDLLTTIPVEAFENPVRPLQSLLFVSFMAEKIDGANQITDNDAPLSVSSLLTHQLVHCEQLVINSWGDVYTKQFSGNTGILQCLCEWTHHAPMNALSLPQRLQVFGHATGDSTYVAQRIERIYMDMLDYFYNRRKERGRFVSKLGEKYYVIRPDESLLQSAGIGNQKLLLEYLEAPLAEFQSTAIDGSVFAEEHLREIYQNNQENIVQVFFRLVNRNCYIWVLDERGSLWRDIVVAHDRDSIVTHCIAFFKKMRRDLHSIIPQPAGPGELEIKQISFNQLGGIEFYTINLAKSPAKKEYLSVQVNIQVDDSTEQLSLVCGGRKFGYEEFKQDVMLQCVRHLSERMLATGFRPVYVTSVNVPLSLLNVQRAEDLQSVHILKFKRNFENGIKRLMDK